MKQRDASWSRSQVEIGRTCLRVYLRANTCERERKHDSRR
jgi:hypothetical protein